MDISRSFNAKLLRMLSIIGLFVFCVKLYGVRSHRLHFRFNDIICDAFILSV